MSESRKVFWGVLLALLVFYCLTNFSTLMDGVIGGITGWDADAKAAHQKQLDLNKEYVRRTYER